MCIFQKKAHTAAGSECSLSRNRVQGKKGPIPSPDNRWKLPLEKIRVVQQLADKHLFAFGHSGFSHFINHHLITLTRADCQRCCKAEGPRVREQERALAGAESTKREIIRVLGISITIPNALEFNYITHFCKREKETN